MTVMRMVYLKILTDGIMPGRTAPAPSCLSGLTLHLAGHHPLHSQITSDLAKLRSNEQPLPLSLYGEILACPD